VTERVQLSLSSCHNTLNMLPRLTTAH